MFRTLFQSARTLNASVRRPAPSRRAFRLHRHQPRLEGLESRLAPSCDLAVPANVLTITCTAPGPNAVAIDRHPTLPMARITLNGADVRDVNDSLFTSIRFNGHDGVDTLNLRANLQPVEVNAAGGDDVITVGSAANTLDSIRGIVTVNAGEGNDALTLNDRGDTAGQYYFLTSWTVERFTSAGIAYDGVEDLRVLAGSGEDAFQVWWDGIPREVVTAVTLDGGDGVDSLKGPESGGHWELTGADTGQITTDFPFSFVSVGYLLGGAGDDLFNGYDEFHVNTGATLTGFIDGGGGYRDTVQGPDDTGGYWVLWGVNTGVVNGVYFTSIPVLQGFDSWDWFTMLEDASLQYIEGGYGTNVLDYSTWTTDVVVNLTLGTATNLGSIGYIQDVIGGAGNDILVGNDASNGLVGGPGRDLLIGGGYDHSFNPDMLIGGEGENLLIAGYTVYDNDPAVLAAILAEWTRPDLWNDYETRYAHLFNGTGLAPALDNESVFSNYAGNYVEGDPAARDLYFVNTDLDTFFPEPNEYVVVIY